MASVGRAARQNDPDVAADRRGGLARGRRRRVEDIERGSLPLSMGINGMTVGLCGVVLVAVWIAPRAAGCRARC